MSYDDSVMIDAPSDSFWEVGNYKRSVKRIDDGHRLCSDLMNCVHERARIEKGYAQQLTEWAKRWKQLLEKGPQYGTLEKAWISLMTEAEKVSELHLEVKSALMNEDFEKIKNWQKEAYHKQMMAGFKETKETDDGFRKAQKPWAKKLKEVEVAKKAYHAACKEEKLAISRESNNRSESNTNPEQLKKLQDKAEKSKQDVQKTKEKYEKSLDELNKCTPQYMENMEQMFEQCQHFENKRLDFFQEVLLEVKQHLDLSATSYNAIYQELEHVIKTADPQEDLKWFRCTYGPGMPMNWPQFEEWSVDLNRTLSRREKPKKTADGVILTSVSQTGEQVPQPPKSSSDEKNPNYTTEWSDDESNNPFNSNEANGDNPFEENHSAVLEVKVRALYDYEGQERDELSFKAGDELTKVEDEDEQGWCKGRLEGGQVGLYPANYVEVIQ
ncbi:protein kinase C and casein kinase substrate in neurons protein 2 isoform X2 [Amblyraja radiata]|uniref:protein kinase C and casein kinase substrate in neurons protein 2 isoform X2 n=1 Tax=Amblyraja radiata TaxID=386614 RepID=UPI00140341C4|nr:protein kinase C and casein kinase substrate in neurons protein 2 isoform X2 [Amblyraja radiata]